MNVRLLACLVVTATVAGVLAPSVSSRPLSVVAAFYTPGHAVECIVPDNLDPALDHLPRPFAPGPLFCWTPNDGFNLGMSHNGRVRRHPTMVKGAPTTKYVTDWATRVGQLRFGQDWVWSVDRRGFGTVFYTCKSRSTGLTCTNRAGHGWWLGRFKGYRIF